MPEEFLICPNCQAKMLGDEVAAMADTTILECTTCQKYFKLGDARPRQLAPAHQLPRRYRPAAVSADYGSSGISIATADIPYRQTVATQVIVKHQTNELGVAAFVTSLLGLLTLGCLSPIALIFSLVALRKPPKGMAVAGLVLSAIGCLCMLIFLLPWIAMAGLFSAAAVNAHSKIGQQQVASADGRGVVTVVLSSVRQETTPLGGVNLVFSMKNTSKKRIANVELEVKFTDYNGEVLARDTVKATLPNPLQPGASIDFTLRARPQSSLATLMPDTAKGAATLLSAQ